MKQNKDWQLGHLAGELVLAKFLPTLSTDLLKTNTVIKVSEEDTKEYESINDDWFSTMGEDDGKWEKLRAKQKQLNAKYYTKELECYIYQLDIDSEDNFKEGLINCLWHSDVCQYSLNKEDITINTEYNRTFITFKLAL